MVDKELVERTQRLVEDMVEAEVPAVDVGSAVDKRRDAIPRLQESLGSTFSNV